MPLRVRTRGRRANKVFSRTYPSIAKKALQIARKNKRQLNSVERKYKAHNNDGQAVDNAITPILLTGLQQGLTDSSRVGDKVKFTSINGRIVFDQNAQDDCCMRFMIIQDRQTNGAQFGSGDLFQNGGTSAVAIVSTIDRDNRKRFKILKDVYIHCNAASTSSTKSFKFFMPLNVSCHYATNIGDITDLTENSISYLLFTDKVNPVLESVNLELRFMDL